MKTLDTRYVRTRKYIMEAFLALVQEKSYDQITIKDITSRANINRVTFYYHFLDKIDLSQKVLEEILLQHVFSQMANYDTLNNETVLALFHNLRAFNDSIHSNCTSNFEAFSFQIEEMMKAQLHTCLLPLLKKEAPYSFRATAYI